jgi:hypothetical protein
LSSLDFLRDSLAPAWTDSFPFRQIVGDPTAWLLNPLGTVTSSLILRKLATTRDKMASPWLCERVTFHSE